MREFAIMCANAVQFNGVEGEVSVGRQAQELWEAFERSVLFCLLASRLSRRPHVNRPSFDREMNQTLSTEFLTESTA